MEEEDDDAGGGEDGMGGAGGGNAWDVSSSNPLCAMPLLYMAAVIFSGLKGWMPACSKPRRTFVSDVARTSGR